MKLKDISFYVSDRATKKELSLRTYVTTDTLYPNKEGRKIAGCLPSTAGSLTKYAKNDVLISNIRPYLKKIWFSDAEGACNNDVLVFRAKENISPEFLYSFLLQDQFFSHVMRGAKGSKMPRGDREQIMDFEAPAPLSIEKEIGTFIANIKRKIDLLREINRNLEAMARQMYEYWFVQFDFPDENGKPYKTSGGKMLWNENLKRMLPEYWSSCKLQNYVGRITNGLNPRNNFTLGGGKNYYVTIRSLTGTTIDWNNCDRCDENALRKINSRSQLKVGDVIFSAIGTIGRTYYILDEPSNWNISETSFVLRAASDVPQDFFYALLRSDELQIKADKAAMGSTLRCLVMDNFSAIELVKIPHNLMWEFSKKIAPIHRMIHNNNKEISELSKQRDFLLPLLMNGQVLVKSQR